MALSRNFYACGFHIRSNVPLSLMPWIDEHADCFLGSSKKKTIYLEYFGKTALPNSDSYEVVDWITPDNLGFKFCIPGVVQFVSVVREPAEIHVSCWGRHEDINFFFLRNVLSELLRLSGSSRLFGSLVRLSGHPILFLGALGSGKTSAACAANLQRGKILADGCIRWANERSDVVFFGSSSSLICWTDVRDRLLPAAEAFAVRGNFKRYMIPFYPDEFKVKGLSIIVVIQVGNRHAMHLEPVTGAGKVSLLSGLVDHPLDFLMLNKSADVFVLHRPRIIRRNFQDDWRSTIHELALRLEDLSSEP